MKELPYDIARCNPKKLCHQEYWCARLTSIGHPTRQLTTDFSVNLTEENEKCENFIDNKG